MSKDAPSRPRQVSPLSVDPSTLPDDPVFLKQLVARLFDALREKDRQIAKLEHHMDLLLKKVYGKSSERLDPNQNLLFEIGADQADEPTTVPEPPSAQTAASPAAGRPTRCSGFRCSMI